MKTKPALSALITALLLFIAGIVMMLLAGCVTDASGQKRPDCAKIAAAIQIAAPPIVAAVLEKHPELRADFALAAETIGALIGADPATLDAAVKARVKEPLVRAAVASALAIYKLEGERYVTNSACAVALGAAVATALRP